MVKRYPLYSSFLFQCLGVLVLTSISLQKGIAQQEYSSPLSLSITFDQWPEESSWDIRIGDSTLVYNADYHLYGDDKDQTTIEIDNINLT